MNLPVQLFIGEIAPSKENFRPIENEDMMVIPKPKHHTGLWTSTYHPCYGSDWVQYNFDSDLSHTIPSHIITPAEDARVFEINEEADLQYLINKYPLKIESPLSPMLLTNNFFAQIDYEKMSNDYDSIHLTELGQIATRFTQPSLHGWDVESTLWLNPAWEKVESLGVIEYEPESQLDF